MLVVGCLAIAMIVFAMHNRTARYRSVESLLQGGQGGALRSMRIQSTSNGVDLHEDSILRAFEAVAARSIYGKDIENGDLSIEVSFEFDNGTSYAVRNAMLDCSERRLILWVSLLKPESDSFTHEIDLSREPRLWSRIASSLCRATTDDAVGVK